MTKVSMSTDLGVPAHDVWELVGDFNSLPEWLPDVEKSVLEKGGKVRRLSIADGSTVVERLDRLDDKTRTCTYTITESDMPVRNYQATIRVAGKDNTCKVEWSSEFEPVGDAAAATAFVRGIYESGFISLRKIFGG